MQSPTGMRKESWTGTENMILHLSPSLTVFDFQRSFSKSQAAFSSYDGDVVSPKPLSLNQQGGLNII